MKNNEILQTILDRSRARCATSIREETRVSWIRADEEICNKIVAEISSEGAAAMIAAAGNSCRNLIREVLVEALTSRKREGGSDE